MEPLYGITGSLFLALAIFVILIDKNDGTALRRIPGLTASAGTIAMTFLYFTLFILEGCEHEVLFRIIISGGLLYALVFYCISVCMYHHWATSLQVVLLVSMAWLVIGAQYAIDLHEFSVFAYVFHFSLVVLATNKLFSCAHGSGKDVQLTKVLLCISLVAYELVWALLIMSNNLDDVSRRASVFVGLDLTLFPIIFVQHLYLPLRAYRTS